MTKIICWDCETGGLQPFRCGLCSITLKVIGEEHMKTIYIKPQPNLKYDEYAFKVNNLSKEILEDKGVSEKEAIEQIKDFIKTYGGFKPRLMAHNIVFDAQFTNALFARNNEEKLFTDLGHYHPIDTMILMRALKDAGIIDIQKLNLSSCYYYFFGKQFQDAHTSDGDVLATEQVYLKIIETMKKLK